MKVSLIQMSSVSDKAANLAAAHGLIEKAVQEERPDWILLPEQFDWAGGRKSDKLQNAESLPGGAAYSLVQGLAAKHRVFIHAGSIMEKIAGEERIHNTGLVFDRAGHEIARYRKMHLFDVITPDGADYRESDSVKAGNAVVSYDCEGVRVGCTICYDLRFPSLFEALVDQGVQMIAVPSAFTLQTGKDHWEVLLRARAIETQTYICAAGQTGAFSVNGEIRQRYGHSLIVDPWGHVVARASDGVGIVSTRLHFEYVNRVRTLLPTAQHRRFVPTRRTP